MLFSRVILNAVKNLAASTNIQRLANLEILRSAQDDNVGCKHALYVILNAVKNLSGSTYIDHYATLEILRLAQDDIVFLWVMIGFDMIL